MSINVRMQMVYYRSDLLKEGFDPQQTAMAIREQVITSRTPDRHRESATVFRLRATDQGRRAEPYTFDWPLPEWAVGVLFIADVTFEPVIGGAPLVAPSVRFEDVERGATG